MWLVMVGSPKWPLSEISSQLSSIYLKRYIQYNINNYPGGLDLCSFVNQPLHSGNKYSFLNHLLVSLYSYYGPIQIPIWLGSLKKPSITALSTASSEARSKSTPSSSIIGTISVVVACSNTSISVKALYRRVTLGNQRSFMFFQREVNSPLMLKITSKEENY